MNITHIISTQKLKELVSHLCKEVAAKKEIAIGLDTEFWRVRTYWPQICLVQVCYQQDVYIIDPFKVDLKPLVPILMDEKIIKIMHAGDQDCEIFIHDFDIMPARVMDTQLAARMLDMGHQLGLAGLVLEILGEELDKSEQHGKWRERPLTEEQISYAARDVIYLPKLYDHFVKKLKTKAKLKEWETQTANVIAHVKKMQDPSQVWQRWDSNRYNAGTRERLKVFAEFRERMAQEKDLPRTRLFTDEALMNLVTKPITSKRALKGLRGMSKVMVANAEFYQLIQDINKPV